MTKQKSSRLSTTLLSLVVILFTISLVIYPQQSFTAGIAGLKVFWDIVFPSLLPFFILSELLLGFGVVRGFGVVLEPLMRPLFSVPGIGAFALSMGLAAGYPMDAVITARFREQNLCSRVEGERLLAFTNTADPLFMFGAVAVGMFKSPAFGALLAIAHYISAFLVGVCFKFWGRREESKTPSSSEIPVVRPRGNMLKRAVVEMFNARDEDGRPFGKLLYDAVTESIQTLLMICGFIVFFAVLIEVMRLSGIISIIGLPVALVYHLFGIHGGLVGPTLAGLLEIDIGTAQTAAVTAAPMIQKLALVSGIIAWSGLSVHAQVASVLTQTDIRMRPYFLARLLHAIFASAITIMLIMFGMGNQAVKTMAYLPGYHAFQMANSGAPWWNVMWSSLSTWCMIAGALAALGVVLYAVRSVRIIAWRSRMNKA